MKKIIIIFIILFLAKNTFALTYSEKAILNEIYYKKAILSKWYNNELNCKFFKTKYNKKFTSFFRWNCFLREKNQKYYFLIYKKNNFETKKSNKISNNNLVNFNLNNNFKNNSQIKYIDLENIKKFSYLLKYLNKKNFINPNSPEIKIINNQLYFKNIYIDIDFIQALQKNIYSKDLLNFYNKNSYKIKQYLDIYRKQKFCKYSINKASKKILNYFYSNNIYIRTNDLTKDLACYIYQNKANYYARTLCTTYKPYRKTNITRWLNSMKKTYPIWKNNNEINTSYWLFNNWTKYVDWLALKVEKWKVKTFKVEWWWLCWVSTILYNYNMHQKKLFSITERWPHMWYYRWYYWPKIWLDATIFWYSKNYKFINNSWEDIIWDYFTYKKWYKFCYWIQSWKLRPFSSETKISSKRYKKNCYKNIVYDEKWKIIDNVKSCYKEIN